MSTDKKIFTDLRFRGLFFSLTLFLSASLMFMVQPMIGKMMLPMVGGSPSGWLVAMAFFQLVLLGGYAFAHFLSRYSPKTHAMVVLAVLLFGMVMLPLKFRMEANDATPGVIEVFVVLIASVSLPFFALSTVSSSLQRLFAASSASTAADPYFLFAASNFGSFCGLLLYPLWVERVSGLSDQAIYWLAGYAVLIMLCVLCFFMARRHLKPFSVETVTDLPAISSRQRWRWVALAFLPSSLMLGVTSYITVEVGSLPLFWVIPLALYLLTFVIVFARHQFLSRGVLEYVLSIGLVFVIYDFLAKPFTYGLSPEPFFVPLAVFFTATLLCHFVLASERPAPQRLTEYYLWVAFGGALGGSFNAFVVPFLFPMPVEFILVALLAGLVHAGFQKKKSGFVTALFWLAGFFALAATFLWSYFGPNNYLNHEVNDQKSVTPLIVLGGVAFYIVATLVIMTARPAWWRPKVGRAVYAISIMVFCLALGCAVHYRSSFLTLPSAIALITMLLSLVVLSLSPRLLFVFALVLGSMAFYFQTVPTLHSVKRNFFGIWRVYDAALPDITQRLLMHGSTVHGAEKIGPEIEVVPRSYYDPNGPLGEIFDTLKPEDVGAVGVGSGAIACYQRPQQKFTMYEIDPDIVKIASEQYYYFSRCGEPDIVLGDGRKSLAAAHNTSYDLFIVDAFTSDMIPIHMLTEQAFQVYFDHIKPNGVLAVHISSRYYDLRGPIGDIAHKMGLNAKCEIAGRPLIDKKHPELGYNGLSLPSIWVVVSKSQGALERFRAPGWIDLPVSSREPWSDDFSDVLSAIDLNRIFEN